MLIRHGDLLFKMVDEIPSEVIKLNTNVVAEGEMTGHKHALVEGEFDLLEHNRIKYLNVKSDTKITHQEHKTLTIPKHQYIVIHEQEYCPFEEEIAKVQD